MRVAVVSDFGLTEITGGYKRNEEVLSRLTKFLDVVVIPSRRDLELAKDGHERELREVLERVDAKLPAPLEEMLDPDFIPDVEADVFYVYSNSLRELELGYKLSKGRPLGVQLQLQPFYKKEEELFKITHRGPRGEERFLKAKRCSEETRPGWERMIREDKLKFATSVSRVPIDVAGLEELGLRTIVTRPANAFDPEAVKWRREGKEDYAVYFTRLIPEKGLFDIPEIWRKVNSERDVRLYVMGKFEDPRDAEDFEREVRDLNVEYLGFMRGSELFRVVSRARVMLYPSHFDSFSLVTLESLAVGTPVVTFDLPAIREVYGSLRDVVKISEDDLTSMAKAVLEAMRRDYVQSPEAIEFLKVHSSWENVARAEAQALLEISSQLR
ncbi:hypothetical protein HS1genome_1318 [Sulfodiicoccus acidiphilus]|uniref:Glycosyl transferase family 1 domain-containing protein n=1 Tax=Sulfodiicoccus acidiphilus TaxID=1670455 RepID=A0A348B427_9CREN|nr:glycosyltransferase [Sulfodiicoccus acidiphilus]BBD72929.1 hypothetical protein HS1genome_1318 [Sulfodiicoccus acidiphilus]GGT87925.1 hypothetical protein GCM10007116_02340 [Sulfodiicoccus acidiphilus]